MSTDLMPFDYGSITVRTVVIDGEPEFVAADVCRVLEHSNPSAAISGLDDDERGLRIVETPSGAQQMATVTEAGLYSLIIRSRKPEARNFRRWITHEVLPAIRKTGGYGQAAVAPKGAELLALAVVEAQQMLAAKDERIAELEPKAEVADRLLDAEGDLSVRDAAQSLTRAGVKTGQGRLFAVLNERRWIRRAGDGRWRVMQYAIDHGFMSVLPQSHYHPKTGELVMDPPQPRVTAKGLQRLLQDFTRGGAA